MGLSMGGGQTLQIGLTHLDLFSGLGVFGNGMTRADFENRHKAVLADVAGTNKKLDLFWIGVGKDDPVRARAKELSDTLTSNGISHQVPRDGWWTHLSRLAQTPGRDGAPPFQEGRVVGIRLG